jgi:UDP-3-O-[3-hydroxymyristoyl] glucosamine N-acyltransferase
VADPRFYTNRGPLPLAHVCAQIGLPVPNGAAENALVQDLATVESGGPRHLVFCATKASAKLLPQSRAGYCIAEAGLGVEQRDGMVLLNALSAVEAFAVVARLLYPDADLPAFGEEAVSPSARIGRGVALASGVTIGAGAEIGDGTQLGPNAVIGPGVAIGRDCRIGSSVSISHACLGDDVMVLPGAQIGQPGFGFTSGKIGHAKIPQLGRVIVQDHVEIGACTTIDRGALGDTVIGEGTKIDNLVQIGHNCVVGRHCIIVGQVGMSGSGELGEFVVLGGQAGLADHVRIGDGARLAARSAVVPGELPGGQDYGGAPAIPVREWRRQMAAFALLGRRRKKDEQR